MSEATVQLICESGNSEDGTPPIKMEVVREYGVDSTKSKETFDSFPISEKQSPQRCVSGIQNTKREAIVEDKKQNESFKIGRSTYQNPKGSQQKENRKESELQRKAKTKHSKGNSGQWGSTADSSATSCRTSAEELNLRYENVANKTQYESMKRKYAEKIKQNEGGVLHLHAWNQPRSSWKALNCDYLQDIVDNSWNKIMTNTHQFTQEKVKQTKLKKKKDEELKDKIIGNIHTSSKHASNSSQNSTNKGQMSKNFCVFI